MSHYKFKCDHYIAIEEKTVEEFRKQTYRKIKIKIDSIPTK